MANKRRICYAVAMDEDRKRVIGIMTAILASLHMQTADDLFGGPQGRPRSDKLIAASVQWAEKIMEKIDNVLRSLSAIACCVRFVSAYTLPSNACTWGTQCDP